MAEEEQDWSRSRVGVSGDMKEHLIMNLLNYLKKIIQLKNLENGRIEIILKLLCLLVECE